MSGILTITSGQSTQNKCPGCMWNQRWHLPWKCWGLQQTGCLGCGTALVPCARCCGGGAGSQYLFPPTDESFCFSLTLRFLLYSLVLCELWALHFVRYYKQGPRLNVLFHQRYGGQKAPGRQWLTMCSRTAVQSWICSHKLRICSEYRQSMF